jgi:hypothetical protein
MSITHFLVSQVFVNAQKYAWYGPFIIHRTDTHSELANPVLKGIDLLLVNMSIVPCIRFAVKEDPSLSARLAGVPEKQVNFMEGAIARSKPKAESGDLNSAKVVTFFLFKDKA